MKLKLYMVYFDPNKTLGPAYIIAKSATEAAACVENEENQIDSVQLLASKDVLLSSDVIHEIAEEYEIDYSF